VTARSIGIAVVITLKLGSVIKHTAALFFCSVMLSSWYGGLWPGVFVALLSVVALDYYFIPPLYAFGISLEGTPNMVAFVSTGVVHRLAERRAEAGERVAPPSAQ
jgi:K+-sensing histidine kinase KdpD